MSKTNPYPTAVYGRSVPSVRGKKFIFIWTSTVLPKCSKYFKVYYFGLLVSIANNIGLIDIEKGTTAEETDVKETLHNRQSTPDLVGNYVSHDHIEGLVPLPYSGDLYSKGD
ncbi:hypothetical protein RF11_04802 [Thelohanellus kitauei]|uniref:Uncharacterized protein n=1 Tax=Thelohanellus kitauei TaxID=669202 RepID=A0A0C2J4T2_THEKT|nr:hypothetical protein RF11_04802 [Thelohanellus kitauei]